MDQLNQIKNQIDQLETFKKNLERNQLSFPLDSSSRDNLSLDLCTPNGSVVIPSSLATYNAPVEVDLNGRKFYLETTDRFTP